MQAAYNNGVTKNKFYRKVSNMVTAIYDGYCVICNTTRRVVKMLDWFDQVEFLDLHDREAVESRYPSIDHDTAMGQIHVVDNKGKVYAGFPATRRMLRAVPPGIPLYLIMRMPIIGGYVGPAIYRFIAKHRYKINQVLGVDLEAQQREEDQCEDGVCKLV
jgi:predicted DCC family thiol-disulfide oxidoreductase YuxK